MEDVINSYFGSTKECAAELEKSLHAIVYMLDGENCSSGIIDAMKNIATMQEIVNGKNKFGV